MDKTIIICPETSAGINARPWWWSHVGPLFSHQRSRSCSRTRFCSTLDLLQQLTSGSNFTEATVASDGAGKDTRARSAARLFVAKPASHRLPNAEQALLQQRNSGASCAST